MLFQVSASGCFCLLGRTVQIALAFSEERILGAVYQPRDILSVGEEYEKHQRKEQEDKGSLPMNRLAMKKAVSPAAKRWIRTA